jgi:Reverse transcriptase (RNA-dependent DNA polymerase).
MGEEEIWNKHQRKKTDKPMFTDDAVVFAKSAKELEAMLTELSIQSQETGLEMNPTKTKILSNLDYIPATVNGASIQYCLDYTYFSQTVSMIENIDSEILEPEVPAAQQIAKA